MKKILIGTSALVAASALAGVANAAEPLKLSVGGFGSVFVGYASQEDKYLKGLRDFGDSSTEVSAVDVKGDNELHFKAKSTLDNGLTVGFKVEMEAGGKDPSGKVVDEYHISLGGAFGTIIAGADDNALAAIANRAPHMGGRLLGAGLSDGDMVEGLWILKPKSLAAVDTASTPTAVTIEGAAGGYTTYVDTNGDSESISYLTPAIAGFTLGATYVPDAKQGRNKADQPFGKNTLDAYGVGLAYAGKFGDLGVNADIGWLTGDHPDADSHNEYQAGLHLSYGGFMIGGGYRLIDQDYSTATGTPAATSTKVVTSDADAWEVGVGYKSGPYGIALGYTETSIDKKRNITTTTPVIASTASSGKDKTRIVQLTSEYTMGPGVMLVGGLGYAKYDDKTISGNAGLTADQRKLGKNSGWVAVTGLSLAF
ncbi:porin [Haematospirillum jordaniae]|nr:porin [Haematospirillum jordaniae]NKD44589.1 porin [Haematospirillum jordaniae]NKD57609.1 porin [Haematospirillum jordaniae]NKD59179.1 porin [Haematospirillum jordaniae]NKD67317.1 porin [Haematospirillum jordaniae]NKD79542.1 porin [Haematospirillum jordaniae]